MAEDARSAAERSPMVVSVSIRVRFGETDMGGVVYYANYFDYFTDARHHYLKTLGMSFVELQQQEGITFAVVAASCRYHASAYFDDLLQVRTWVAAMRSRSLTFAYEIHREQTLIAAGTTELMFFREGKAVSMPPRLRHILRDATAEKGAAVE